MTALLDFTDRVVIVTGAGRRLGLGAAYARLLAQRGARVVVNDVLDATEVVDEIRAQAVSLSRMRTTSAPTPERRGSWTTRSTPSDSWTPW